MERIGPRKKCVHKEKMCRWGWIMFMEKKLLWGENGHISFIEVEMGLGSLQRRLGQREDELRGMILPSEKVTLGN